jgi:hypothetical protein
MYHGGRRSHQKDKEGKDKGAAEKEEGIMSTHTQGVAHHISSSDGDKSYIPSWCGC